MNLAKIRQKALKGATMQTTGAPAPVAAALQETDAHRLSLREPEPVSSAIEAAPASAQEGAAAALPAPSRMEPPKRHRHADPLEAILAGRRSAGCDDDSLTALADESVQETREYEEILCVRVSDETYGINIMEIKEIITPRETTEVPRAPAFVLGVLSLRGVIIPVLDLRERLGLGQGSRTGRERIVVVKQGDGFSGLLVDEVIHVIRIGSDSFEPPPAVLEGSDRDFVAGIGRKDGMMVILLNLARIADINLC
jgi:purine-binding chemotaxis protein CheW